MQIQKKISKDGFPLRQTSKGRQSMAVSLGPPSRDGTLLGHGGAGGMRGSDMHRSLAGGGVLRVSSSKSLDGYLGGRGGQASPTR